MAGFSSRGLEDFLRPGVGPYIPHLPPLNSYYWGQYPERHTVYDNNTDIDDEWGTPDTNTDIWGMRDIPVASDNPLPEFYNYQYGKPWENTNDILEIMRRMGMGVRQ